MDDVVIINDTPMQNSFTKALIGAGALWIGFIAYNKIFNISPAREHDTNKRYQALQETKLNRDLAHMNRALVNVKKPSFFQRHNRFRKNT